MPNDNVALDLDAFYTEHQCCGELDAGMDETIVWFDCECGASIVRRVNEEDAGS